MMEQHNEYATIEVITPEKAQEYLTHNKVNRPVSQKLVDFYAAQMAEGKWRLNGEGISFLKNGNLSDGQHRLLAVIQANVPIRITVTRGADNDAFWTYDSGRNRTISDVFSLADIPNYNWVSVCVQRYMLICRGMGAFTKGGNRKASNGISKVQLIEEYHKNAEIFQAAALLGRRAMNETRVIPAAAVSGMAAYLTIEKRHKWETVECFFEMLDKDIETKCNSIKLLRTRLRREKFGTIQKSSNKYVEQLVIRCWNDLIMGNNDRKTLRWNEQAEGKLTFI